MKWILLVNFIYAGQFQTITAQFDSHEQCQFIGNAHMRVVQKEFGVTFMVFGCYSAQKIAAPK